MKIQRLAIVRIHAYLACFIMPMATLYFIGGAFYSSDIKGEINKQVYQLPLESDFVPELAQLSALARNTLEQKDLVFPGGGVVRQ